MFRSSLTQNNNDSGAYFEKAKKFIFSHNHKKDHSKE